MHGIDRQRWAVYIVAALASLLLSSWAAIREAVINPDAICYLQSAQTMQEGFKVAMELCGQAKWPFYSALIYGVTQLTHLSSLHAAYLLNGMLSCISVVAFIAIIESLSKLDATHKTRLMWFAAIVILLAHEFNAVREYIVRDHGFWAFYLVSIGCLIKFFRADRWCYAFAWSMSLMVATLFRIEGIIFLGLLPFMAFIACQHSRFKSFLKLNTLTLIGIFFGMLGLFIFHPDSRHLSRLSEIQFQLGHGIHEIIHRFQESANMLSQHILSQYSSHDSMLILFLVLLTWYFIQIIVNLSIIYSVLVVYAWFRKVLTSDRSAHLVLWSYILVNVGITIAFLFENMFLSKRYLLALSLTLMCWVPFALNALAQQWSRRKWPLCIVLVLIIISSLGGIFDFGYSKAYIRDAGLWLEKNIPANAKLYANDYQLMYYSQHFGNDIFEKGTAFSDLSAIATPKWKDFDYIAIRLNINDDKDSTVVKELGKPVQVFMNKRGDAVSIYQIQEKVL